MQQRKLIVYIAASTDGFIAGEQDELDFLSIVEQAGEDYGYQRFIETVDTVIVGKRTYDKVLSMGYPFPHGNKQAYIITHTPQASEGSVHFYNGDLIALVQQLKQQAGQHIFCDGGASIIHQLLSHRLVDELYISVIPVLLGSGISLFKSGRPMQPLQLLSATSYPKGLVQLHYQCLPAVK